MTFQHLLSLIFNTLYNKVKYFIYIESIWWETIRSKHRWRALNSAWFVSFHWSFVSIFLFYILMQNRPALKHVTIHKMGYQLPYVLCFCMLYMYSVFYHWPYDKTIMHHIFAPTQAGGSCSFDHFESPLGIFMKMTDVKMTHFSWLTWSSVHFSSFFFFFFVLLYSFFVLSKL